MLSFFPEGLQGGSPLVSAALPLPSDTPAPFVNKSIPNPIGLINVARRITRGVIIYRGFQSFQSFRMRKSGKNGRRVSRALLVVTPQSTPAFYRAYKNIQNSCIKLINNNQLRFYSANCSQTHTTNHTHSPQHTQHTMPAIIGKPAPAWKGQAVLPGGEIKEISLDDFKG